MKKLYRYHNPNPSKKEVGDCVERALCVATGRDWLSVYDELCIIGREVFAPPGWKSCYETFLRNNNFSYVGVSNKKGTKRPTVEEFVKLHKTGNYVLVVANHLVGVTSGQYCDIWDSGEKCLYGYWVDSSN